MQVPFIKLRQFVVAKESLETVVDAAAKERTKNFVGSKFLEINE